MFSIIFTSAVWYTIPKGIEYLTTDCGTHSQSKMRHIRTKLFGCKHALKNIVYANTFTEFFYKALKIPCTRMWIAVLITPSVKQVLPFKSPIDRLLQIAICYSLFSSKYFLKSFINSSRGIKCITSLWSLKILHTNVGLDFIKSFLSEEHWRQMRTILELRLQPSDTYDFLRARDKENLLSVVERVKQYKSDKEVKQLLSIIKRRYPERFGIVGQDPLEHLPQQTREILLGLSDFTSDFSILDSMHFDVTSSQSLLFGSSLRILEYISIISRCLFSSLFQNQCEPLLPKLPDYPEDIHDIDPILNKIQCPLLFRTIRSAIVDPTNQKTIYDRKTLGAYLQYNRISPITKKEICSTFNSEMDRGSKYDTILRYRKACLRLEKLKEPEEFMANLKQVFAEISQLENIGHLKQASEEVRNFFQDGLLSAYDILNSIRKKTLQIINSLNFCHKL